MKNTGRHHSRREPSSKKDDPFWRTCYEVENIITCDGCRLERAENLRGERVDHRAREEVILNFPWRDQDCDTRKEHLSRRMEWKSGDFWNKRIHDKRY